MSSFISSGSPGTTQVPVFTPTIAIRPPGTTASMHLLQRGLGTRRFDSDVVLIVRPPGAQPLARGDLVRMTGRQVGMQTHRPGRRHR